MKNKNDKLQHSDERDTSVEVEHTRPGAVFAPAVDIYENEGAITLVANLPGVRAEDLEIDLRDGTLTLSGGVTPTEHSGETDVLREFETGTYYRQFRLSDRIDQSKIDARIADGVLTLELPKVEAARPRQITVKAG